MRIVCYNATTLNLLQYGRIVSYLYLYHAYSVAHMLPCVVVGPIGHNDNPGFIQPGANQPLDLCGAENIGMLASRESAALVLGKTHNYVELCVGI